MAGLAEPVGALFLLLVDLFLQRLARLGEAGFQLHPDGDAVRAYLLEAFRVVFDFGQLLVEVCGLPLQGREGGLFELPVTLAVEQGALLQLERMALLLHRNST